MEKVDRKTPTGDMAGDFAGEKGRQSIGEGVWECFDREIFCDSTPQKMNECPLKGAISKGKDRLPTTMFQVAC